jgi:hypothetical protein
MPGFALSCEPDYRDKEFSKDVKVLTGFDEHFNLNSDDSPQIRELFLCGELTDRSLCIKHENYWGAQSPVET